MHTCEQVGSITQAGATWSSNSTLPSPVLPSLQRYLHPKTLGVRINDKLFPKRYGTENYPETELL